MGLREDQAYYRSHKKDFLKNHEEKFVLIKDQKIHGFFNTEQEAFEGGIELFGAQDMFIKHILKEDPRHFIPAFSTNPHAHP